jgi:hypothetical protein
MRKAQAWNQPCPNSDCQDHQRMNRGNISAVATYLTASGKRRIFHCKTCDQNFAETRDTVFFDLRTPEEKVMLALKMLLVRVDWSGIAFVLGVTEESVLEWLSRAAQQAERINQHLLRELPVTQIQLDEMWNFIERKHSTQGGDEMLFVVREANLDLTLAAETLYSSRADLISARLLMSVKALGFRIRAVISDADQNIRRAVRTSLPGCPHQACQVHCLCDAGQPIFNADRAMKTDLRRDIRAKWRPFGRRLSQASADDPQSAVLTDYSEVLRDALRAEGLSPFELAGLKLYDELARMEASLRRCQKKGGTLSWRSCWTLPRSVTGIANSISRSNINATGSLN